MLNKIKLVIITTVHPPFDTRIFHKEAKTLYKAGYEVVLIAQHDRFEVVDGICVVPLPKPRNRFERMFRLTWKTFWLALRENSSIYHFHDPELMPVGAMLKLLGKKVVYDMHENVSKQILNKDWIYIWIRKPLVCIFNLIERLLLNNIPVIFAEKSYVKDYSWVRRSEVVLNMPQFDMLNEFVNQEKDSSAMNIGYLGGVSEIRGSYSMIEAMSILKTRGFNCHFHCVGSMSLQHKKELEFKCDQLNFKDVCFYGRLNAPNGYKIISNMNIGLAVLKPIGNYFESYPTKMFEYMALGIPVVVSFFPLWSEVVDGSKCGLCVDPLNSQEIANAIQWLLEHPQEAKEMGRNGRCVVLEKYNWNIEEKKLLDFYRQL